MVTGRNLSLYDWLGKLSGRVDGWRVALLTHRACHLSIAQEKIKLSQPLIPVEKGTGSAMILSP